MAIGTAGVLGMIGFLIAPALFPEPPNTYRTSAFQIDMPQGWQCQREGSEIVCMPDKDPPVDAIMIAAMKYRGAGMDSTDAYAEHLGRQKQHTMPDGTQLISRVEYVNQRKIGNHKWVDSLHFQSELADTYTRYLVTVTSHIGIAVTMSASSDSYEKYVEPFELSLASIEIYQRYDAGP